MKRSIPHAFEPEEIMAYLDGELEAQQAAALASHLEHCSECGVLAIRLRQISERMLDFQVEPSPAALEAPIMAALESTDATLSPKLQTGTEPKSRRFLRGFAWAASSLAAVVVIGALVAPRLRESTFTPTLRGKEFAGKTVVDLASRPPMEGRANSLNSLVTLALPGVASDSSGLFHGLGDHATNSLSINGQPIADQQSKVFSNGIEAPELHGPMIVQTASITILATNYDQASGAIHRVTAQHGGYIQDMTADSRTGMARSVSATLRVPGKQLEAFLADLRTLGHVEQETRNNQEITDQYIDLTARLRTARATESRITELLKTQTGKLSDVLDAERELARIRGEIESMEGQRANMQHQVSYATVQVQLNEEYREQLNAQAYSTGTRVRNSLVQGFKNLADGAVALVIFLFAYGPSLLFWVALFGVPAWFLWRHYRRPKIA